MEAGEEEAEAEEEVELHKMANLAPSSVSSTERIRIITQEGVLSLSE